MRAVRPHVAYRNPRIAGATVLAGSYQPADLTPVQSAVLGAQQIAQGVGGRIAQVYATPQGKFGIGLAAAAPFVVPMVMGGSRPDENPEQKPYSTGYVPSNSTGLNASSLVVPGAELPDEAAVKRKLQQLEDNQYYNELTRQALMYAAANRGSIESAQMSQPAVY